MIAMIDTLRTRNRAPRWVSLEDHALVAACLEGHDEAWEEMVARYGRLVYTVATKVGLSHSDAEEVFQVVFTRLHDHLESIRDRTSLPSWLITTTRRESYRVGKRTSRMQSATEVMLDREIDETHAIERLERQQMVRQALRQLSERDQDLLTALFLQSGAPDYSVIAQELHMRIGSIGPTRARALERLRVVLERMGFDSQNGMLTEERRSVA